VERLAVQAGSVRQVVQRPRHVVDRHDVGVAEIDADQRQPLGEGVAHPLQQREEVVRPVDLVHRAGLGVPDDDRGTVDPPRDLGLVADDPLGLVLRLVVRRRQALPLVEHRLVERAGIVARRGDRRDLVEAAGAQRGRESQRLAGAADVETLVALRLGRQVVERRQVEDVFDPAGVFGDPVVVDAEPWAGQVADDGNDPSVVAPAPAQQVESVQRAGPDAHEDVTGPALEQLLDQVPPDEAGRAGDEVRHGPTVLASSAGCLHSVLRSVRSNPQRQVATERRLPTRRVTCRRA
jgi:hypothetical protein